MVSKNLSEIGPVSLNFQSDDRFRPVKGKHVYFALAGGFPGGSDGKESACYVRDPGLLPGLGRSPGVGNGNPLQYYCLGNPMNRGAWWVSPLGCKSDMTLQLNNKQQSTE